MSETNKSAEARENGKVEQFTEGLERASELTAERERNASELVNDTEKNADNARKELERVSVEKEKKQENKPEQSPAEKRKSRILDGRHSSRKLSFKKTMAATRSEMSPASKTFSKLIHAPVIEKTSEAIGNTVARPNAILSGSLLALIFTAGIYTWARYAGYPLSGFETIAAFIVGWLVGIIIDFTRIMITGKE